jgi:hypothetical protein
MDSTANNVVLHHLWTSQPQGTSALKCGDVVLCQGLVKERFGKQMWTMGKLSVLTQLSYC